jgi:imidazolonepropionase-like amidohydrolase/ABC-type multidrug transport system permease subunit
MRPYLATIRINLKLTFRDRLALFFSYAFPLIFFFIFAQATDAQQGGVINHVVGMVFIIGILGNGFFGAGLRAVQDREANILRRFKVAPITAAPILIASLVTGWIFFAPSALIVLGLSHFRYGMPVPVRLGSLCLFLTLGVLAFRSIGLIIAAIVNSMQESQILIQILYLPMLFLSGATFPLDILPTWLQIVAQFLPSSHLYLGMQAILVKNESLLENLNSVAAMLITAILATWLAIKLFRWEKDEKIPATGKLWLVAVLTPFLLLGTWQAYSHENVRRARVYTREMRRGRTLLIRNVRIFTGDKLIPTGAVLVKEGKIAQVFEGPSPDAKSLKAEAIEASGKTLLPGLIDMHVHLGAPGGMMKPDAEQPDKRMLRELAAYVFSGVTAVRSCGDSLNLSVSVRKEIATGERAGAALFACGPMFTTEGGHGTEYFRWAPEPVRQMLERETLRLPKSPDEARQQVAALKQGGVDCIKAILEGGMAGMLFNRLDPAIYRALADEARRLQLPLATHTGDSADDRLALEARTATIEHGSTRDRIPDDLLKDMARNGVAYDPTLSVIEAFNQIAAGSTVLLDRTLVQQVGPTDLIDTTRKAMASPKLADFRAHLAKYRMSAETAADDLLRAHKAGARLIAGSDSGNLLLIHGPAIHRELQLWVSAGIPPAVALQSATMNAAQSLGAADRFGSIRAGLEANLLLVDGNPLDDISSTERISMVVLRGERMSRSELFEQK